MNCESKGCILWNALVTIALALTTSCYAAVGESSSLATSYFTPVSSKGKYYYYPLPSQEGPHTLFRYYQEPSRHHPFQRNYKQSNQWSTLLPKHLVENIAEQFQSPSLDETAFRMALMSEGYVSKKATASPTFKSVTRTGSLNVKLPVPFGLTPLNNPPLPLQKGAPIASLPKDVTSYGTRYPQRRRRGSNWHRP